MHGRVKEFKISMENTNKNKTFIINDSINLSGDKQDFMNYSITPTIPARTLINFTFKRGIFDNNTIKLVCLR